MSDENAKLRAREITATLADLDLLFEVGKTADPEQRYFWTLRPFSTEGKNSEAVRVVLALEESWLNVFSLLPLQTALTPDQLRISLFMNPELALVKVGLIEEEGKEALWVGQQISVGQINLEALKLTIGAVTVGMREVRKRLKGLVSKKSTS